ncbi:MAG: flavodoxin family protein [Candidatus Omnitrophica bacterium]|nr:flavodoxin family protein [Candidatus Omnitrophota bacterium]
MMKILLISSSPNKEKSQTFFLAKEALKGLLGQDVKHEIIHLCDLKIEFCRHLEKCHKKIMDCPINDDVGRVLQKMLDADGIILASPNYINQITASMKALFDRSAHFIHCKRLLGKYISGVVSSGSGMDKEVLDYIRYYAHTCGAQYSGGVSSAASAVKGKAGEALELGRKMISDIKEKRAYPDQIDAIEKGKQHFSGVMKARKDYWKEEYQYWIDKGWLGGIENNVKIKED